MASYDYNDLFYPDPDRLSEEGESRRVEEQLAFDALAADDTSTLKNLGFYDAFEENFLGDPFRNLQRAANDFRGRLSNLEAGLKRQSSRFAESLGTIYELSNRLDRGTGLYTPIEELPRGRDAYKPDIAGRFYRGELQSGYNPRATSEEYINLMSAGRFKGVFFQFQEKETVSALYGKNRRFEIVTQSLDLSAEDSLEQQQTQLGILGGNQVVIGMSQNFGDRFNVRGVKALGSFHPKVGYSTDDSGQLQFAFLGTQNITPALNRRSTYDPVLILKNRSAKELVQGQKGSKFNLDILHKTETRLANQIKILTDEISEVVVQTGNEYLRPGALTQRVKQQGKNLRNISVEGQTLSRLNKVLKSLRMAESSEGASGYKVFINMGELGLLFNTEGSAGLNDPEVKSLRESVMTLAKRGQLRVITSQKTLDKIQGLDSTSYGSLLAKTLSTQSELLIGNTGYIHDKSIGVIETRTQELKFLSMGSANLSADAMARLKYIKGGQDLRSQDMTRNINQKLGGLKAKEGESTYNVEVNLMMGYDAEEQEYLKYLSPRIVSSLESLGGKTFDRKGRRQISRSGYLAEQYSDPFRVQTLKNKLLELKNSEIGDSIEIKDRYRISSGEGQQLAGVEVSIRPKTGLGLHQTRLFLTVNKSGDVVVSDQNKFITGSTYVNKTRRSRMVGGREVLAGEAVNLSGIETASGLVSTLAQAFEAQSVLDLPTKIIEDYLLRNTGEEAGSKLLGGMIERSLGVSLKSKGINLESLSAFGQRDSVFAERLVSSSAEVSRSAFSEIPKYLDSLNVNDKRLRSQRIAEVFESYVSESLGAGINKLNEVLLNDTENVLLDLKSAYIQGDEFLRTNAISKSRDEVKSLREMMLAPYLQPYALGYSANQARYQRPVYGETSLNKGTKHAQLGLLNPMTVRPGVKTTGGGRSIRLIGASGFVTKTLGALKLNQLRVIKDELESGVVKEYETKGIFQSTGSLGYYTPEIIQESNRVLKNIARDLLIGELGTEGTEEYLSNLTLTGIERDYIYAPFASNKLEQLQQRLKNVLGARQSMVANPEIYKKLIGLDSSVIEDLSAVSLHGGEIRVGLSMEQFLEVKELEKEGKSYEEIRDYFRDQELDPYSTKRGVLGRKGMKRVGINAGVNLMGDYNFTNPLYQDLVMEKTVLSFKFNMGSVDDVGQMTAKVQEAFAKGAFILGRPIEATDTFGQEFLSAFLHESGDIRFEDAKKALKELQLSDKSFDKYLIQKDSESGKVGVFLREGLYTPEYKTVGDGEYETQYKYVTGLTSEGRLTLGYGSNQTMVGESYSPLTVGFPAFTKRYADAISTFYDVPAINADLVTGTMTVQAPVSTMFVPQSLMRLASMGELVKGAILYRGEEDFQHINQFIPSIYREKDTSLGSERLQMQAGHGDINKLYGLFSFNTVKGYSFSTGLNYLTNPEYLSYLKDSSPEDVARASALMLMGSSKDDSVKQALVGHFRKAGNAVLAEQVLISDTKDYSSSALIEHASGLNLLAAPHLVKQEKFSSGGEAIRQTVVAALQGDNLALKHLHLSTTKLFDLVSSTDPQTLGSSKAVMRGIDGSVHFALNEMDPTVRSAAVLADVLQTSRQIFNSSPTVASGLNNTKVFDGGNPSSSVQRYTEDKGFRNKVEILAHRAGLGKLPNIVGTEADENTRAIIERKLKRLQTVIDNQVLLERYLDVEVSSSLTPYSSKDSVSMEYHLTSGVSGAWVKRFSKFTGDNAQALETQRAFATLLSASKVGIPSSDGLMPLRYMLPNNRGDLNKVGYSRQDIEARETLYQWTHLGLQESREQMQQIHSIVYGSDSSIDLKAARLSNTVGSQFKYLDADVNSTGSELQREYLSASSGLEFRQGESALSGIARVYGDALLGYYRDVDSKDSNYSALKSFKQYLSTQGGVVSNIESQYKYLDEITNATGRIKGISRKSLESATGGDQGAMSAIYGQIEKHLFTINEKSLKRLQSDLEKSEGQRYINAMIELQQYAGADSSVGDRARAVLEEVSKSRQILMPALQVKPEGDRYRVTPIVDVAESKPIIGVHLGADVATKAALSFPGFDSSLLNNQFRMERLTSQSFDILNKIITQGSTINSEELNILTELQESMMRSQTGFMELAETDLARKAYGDQQSFTGSVVTAVDALGLSANEAVLGHRGFVTHQNNPMKQVLDTQLSRVDEYIYKNLSTIEAPNELLRTDVFRELGVLAGALDSDSVSLYAKAVSEYRGDLVGSLSSQRKDPEQIKSQQQIRAEFKNKVYAIRSGKSIEEISGMSGRELENSLNLSEIAAFRTGSPTGSAMQTMQGNSFNVMSLGGFNQRAKSENLQFTLDAHRGQMVMLLPTISRISSMGGDFDGDQYGFVTSTYSAAMVEIQKIDREIQKLEGAWDYKRKALQRFKGEDVMFAGLYREQPAVDYEDYSRTEQEVQNLSVQIRELKSQRSETIQRISEHYDSLGNPKHSKDLAQLSDLKDWAGGYMLLPKWMQNDLNFGETLSMVEQIRVLFPSLDDNRELIKGAQERTRDLHQVYESGRNYAINGLLRRTEFDERHAESIARNSFSDNATLELKYKSQDEYVQELRLLHQLNQNKDFTRTKSGADAKDAIFESYMPLVSMAAATGGFNKQLGKAAGTFIDVESYQGVQDVMGASGALLGMAYNSLMPMMDKAIFRHGFGLMLQQNSKDGSATEVLKNSLKDSGAQGQKVIERLGLESKNGLDGYISELNQTVTDTVGFMQGMQQAVRDALKFKSGSGLAKGIQEFSLNDKMLMIESEQVPEEVKDKRRTRLIDEFMETQYKSIDISIKPDNPFADLINPGATRRGLSTQTAEVLPNDYGITGFGALYRLSKYQQAENDQQLGSLIEKDEVWRSIYEKQKQQAPGDLSPDRFIAEQISEQITRAHASFIASRITSDPGSVDSYIESSLRQRDRIRETLKGNKAETILPGDLQEYNLINRFFDLEPKTEGESRNRLRTEFIEAMTLTQARHRGVFNADVVQGLRKERQTEFAITKDSLQDNQAFFSVKDTIAQSSLVVAQQFRRGKMPSAGDMMLVLNAELSQLQDLGRENMFTTEQQANMMMMLGADLVPGDSELSGVLAKAIVKDRGPSPGSQSFLGKFTNHSAVVEQLMAFNYEKGMVAERLLNIGEEKATSKEMLTKHYGALNQKVSEISRGLQSGNIPKNLITASDGSSNEPLKSLEEFSESLGAQLDKNDKRRKGKSTGGVLADSRLEVLGILAAPAVLAMAGAGVGFDERLVSFGYDILQSVPEIAQASTPKGKLTGELEYINRVSQEASKGFARARIQDQIKSQGLIGGAISGLSQELLFAGTGALSQGVTQRLLGTKTGAIPAGEAIGKGATQLLSTAFALGVTRRFTEGIQGDSSDAIGLSDQTADYLAYITQEIWSAAEQTLSNILAEDDVAEVNESEFNGNLDFVASTSSELERDIASGMIVIDEDGEEIPQEFDNSERAGAEQYAGTSSLKSEYREELG